METFIIDEYNDTVNDVTNVTFEGEQITEADFDPSTGRFTAHLTH